MKKKKVSRGAGNWKGFIKMLGSVNMPWLMILVAFIVETTYNHVLLSLPTTTAALMSGSLEDSALIDALIYYISYGVIVTISMVVSGITSRMAVRNARAKVWSGMLRIRMDYYDSHTPAALTSAVTNDLEESLRLLVSLIITLIPSIYYLGGALWTIAEYDWLLVVSVLIPLPLRYIEMVVVGRWNYRTQAGIYQRIGVLTGYLAERVKNLPLIKQFCTEEQELENGTEASEDLFKANISAAKVSSISSGVSTVITVIQQIVVVLFGVILLRQGRITISQWIAFFMFAANISSRFITLVQNWQSLKSIQGQVSRVVEVMEAPKEQTEKEIQKADERSAAESPTSDICFENVSFAYGEKQALRNISFTVPDGTSTAIVGLCGSGKTTLLNLLERFYDSGEGKILLGGKDISVMPLSQLRASFSYVQQDAGVFSGTVRQILTYGIRRNVTDGELITAAKNAGAWDFVHELPGELDAQISADGQSLSGGQRQRLVLAREFLRNADILLLDEPTSALDAITAQAVEETIFRMFRGKTILMITHDMSLLDRMDQIIVLQEGNLLDKGSYCELIKRCELFRDMVCTQKKEVETV